MNGEEELKNANNNKRKKIVIGGFILLFFILMAAAAYGIYVLKFKKPSQIIPPQVLTPLPSPLEEFEQCQKADYDKTPHYGEHAKDVFYKIAEIMANKDVGACNGLGDNKDFCFNTYYKFLTLKEGASAYIEKLASAEDVVVGKAYINNNPSLCDQIKDDVINKGICKAISALDPKYCSFTQEQLSSKENCLSVSDEEGGIKIGCGDITRKEAQSLCLNSYYAAKALKEKNINECSKIDNITGRFTRLNCLALLSNNPKEEINKFYRENACYEKYATMVAQIKNDPSICERIPLKDGHNKEEYENCVDQFK